MIRLAEKIIDDKDISSLVEWLQQSDRFTKGEQDMVAMYQQMFAQSLTLLKALGDGKLRGDTYREGQYTQVVT